MMSLLADDILKIFSAVLLVFINGFFVAAEFGLVKVRESRQLFSPTALWLFRRSDASQ